MFLSTSSLLFLQRFQFARIAVLETWSVGMHVPMRKELETQLVIATNVIPLMDLMDKEGRAASSMLMVTHKNAKMFLKVLFIIMVIICVC